MRGIKNYWIREVGQLKEFEVLSEIEDTEIARVEKEVDTLYLDQFIESATETGVARREKMLGITPHTESTLEERRFMVLSYWNQRLPYTYRVLVNRLTQLCGEGGFETGLNTDTYSLSVRLPAIKSYLASEVNALLRQMLPAHLITTSVFGNVWRDVGDKTWGELAVSTWEEVRTVGKG